MQCSKLAYEGVVRELTSDSLRAACSAVWSMLLLCSSPWWLCVVICCFRVWLHRKALGSVSHYSITIAYAQTQEYTHDVCAWAQQLLSLYHSSHIQNCIMLSPFFFWWAKEWLQFIIVMKHWVHRQACKSLHTWADGKYGSLSPLAGWDAEWCHLKEC